MSSALKVKLIFYIRCLAGVTGGAERAVLNLSSQLVGRGYDVSVATFDKFQGAPFYPYDPRVKIINLNPYALPLEEASTASQMRNKAKKKKPRKVGPALKNTFAIARLLSPFNEGYLKKKEETELRALEKFANQQKPICILGFMVDTSRIVGRCGQDLGIPSILALRNDPELDYKWSHELLRERLAGQKAMGDLKRHHKTAVLVPLFASELAKRAPVTTAVIPNFIEIGKFEVGRAVPLSRREKRILFVGRFTEVKRPLQLLKAFSLVAENHPDWTLKFVGEGRLERALRDQLQAFRLSSRVTIAGVTSDIANEYASAQVLCQPSIFEGFSQVLGEAMASGVPCIGDIECRSSAHLLDEGRGLLVEGKSFPKALADGLGTLMNSAELREQLSAKAYDFISLHTPEEITDRWEHLLMASCNVH